MEKWLKERVLHRYVIENFEKCRHAGQKILRVRDNKDQFPDLFCTLEDGTEKFLLRLSGSQATSWTMNMTRTFLGTIMDSFLSARSTERLAMIVLNT